MKLSHLTGNENSVGIWRVRFNSFHMFRASMPELRVYLMFDSVVAFSNCVLVVWVILVYVCIYVYIYLYNICICFGQFICQ